MNEQEKTPTNAVLELLESIRQTPERDPSAAAQGRAHFLAEAASLRLPKAVTPFQRLAAFMTAPFLYAKQLQNERPAMFVKFVSALVLVAIIFSGGSLTAFAAQDSLPDEALYPLKLWTEDLRLELRSDDGKQVELLTSFANRRVDEFVSLVNTGSAVPDQVIVRLDNELDSMLQLLQEMDDDELAESANYVRIHLRDRDQLMTMIGAPENSDARLEQLQHMLQEQHMMAELGQDEPLTFRQMLRHENEQDMPGEPPEPPNGNQYGDTDDPEVEPPANGDGFGPGPQAGENEPTGPNQTPEPQDAQPGPGFQNGQPADEPGNLDPGPDSPIETEEPADSGNQWQQGPQQPANSMPPDSSRSYAAAGTQARRGK